ncbi:hypothetical protein HGRIS_006973 [Hohenbuehelia grisea]|uniref:ubiquitinyl hydrolase 1 n=1 Tax=Hohenbuehelia grisea TaxID=104357 RepID=A0ABR3JB83_9AGAR
MQLTEETPATAVGNEPQATPAAATVTPDTDLASLSQAQLYDLNQELLNDSVPSRPLIDEVSPMTALREEYENGSQSFVQQIDWLMEKGYKAVRRTKGDGDCFYRSVAFAYVDRIIHSADVPLAAASAASTIQSTLSMLDMAGFQKLVFEDFYDVLVSLIESTVQPDAEGRTVDDNVLLEQFQMPEVSNSIVVFLRLLTSAQIRTDPESYEAFLFHPELGEQLAPREFCESLVEAVGKEADHVQIMALSRALHLDIDIAYLDGRNADGKVDFVDFRNSGDKDAQPLILLYRPGHYDILLKTG